MRSARQNDPMSSPLSGKSKAAKSRELRNEAIRYTMWSVFRLADVLGEADRSSEAAEVEKSSSWPARTSSSGASTTSAGCAPTPT